MSEYLNNPQLKTNNQYVVSYNSDNFIWNNISSSTTDKLITSSSIPAFCNLTEEEKKTRQTKTCKDTPECEKLLFNLCNNYSYSKTIQNLQTNHSGADSRYNDVTTKYNYELLKSVNLGIGIVYLSIMLYYNYKK